MKKLGVVITDGVGFRNFVLSDFLMEAEKEFDEVVILSCLPASVYLGKTKLRIIELSVFEEHFKTWFFRKAKEVAHLQRFKKENFGFKDALTKNVSLQKSARGYATQFISRFTAVFNSENTIQKFKKLQDITFLTDSVTKEYRLLLEVENFDHLFFTHQRPPYIAPLVVEAKKYRIATSTFIFSWDNLASKGRMAADFENYLVWSDFMKNDLLTYYPKIKRDNISVVGTPQFEPYVLKRYAMLKEDFLKEFELDISKKIICFSCGDISTSKNDELYISTIAETIENNIIKNAQLLVRTSPAEDPIRFKEISEKYSFIKWNYPAWNVSRNEHQEAWSQRVPSINDVKILRALLDYSDLNVNMLSTMSLDFMLFDKPVINPVFGNADNELYNDQRFLKYNHIKTIVDTKASKIVKNKTELVDAINTYLQNPELNAENRKKLIDLHIGRPLQNTSKRIAQTLLQWS